jgi:hypothetical protein
MVTEEVVTVVEVTGEEVWAAAGTETHRCMHRYEEVVCTGGDSL